jgi:hypothetical protein
MARILFFDIEISPIISYNWKLWKSNAIDVVEDWQILCFAYKWADRKIPHVVGQDDFDDWEPGVNDDKNVVEELHKLFDEADILVAHNGDRYDIKKAHARMMQHGMKPPSPSATVDTLKAARKVAGFSSNSLEYLCKSMDLKRKKDMGGIEVIKGCLSGVRKDWKHMKDYCKADVEALEELYYELRPWMTSHPSLAVLDDQPEGCPKCGSHNLRKGGFYATKTGKRKRYQCLDCGGWTKGRKIYRDPDLNYMDSRG